MPSRKREASAPKRVVYLWGAGATQAEISHLGARNINLLMRDSEELGEGIATRILKQLPPRQRSRFLVDEGTDIEKLISLLSGCNVAEYHKLAEHLRQLYFVDISSKLAEAKVLLSPTLAIGLLSLHNDPLFARHEHLSGVITTNHDGLMQLASQKVYSAVNIGIPFKSSDLEDSRTIEWPVIQLHGSFTWTFGMPLTVTPLTPSAKYSPNTVWIPPTILKDPKAYPFNKLSGLAYELLSKHCDVLRVVGSSLTQNDWNVLSIIFNAQRHAELTRGRPFRIELIMPQGSGENVKKECSYLQNLVPIGHLTEGSFASYKETARTEYSAEMSNPLFYWLKEKIQFHRKRGDVGTSSISGALAVIAGDLSGSAA